MVLGSMTSLMVRSIALLGTFSKALAFCEQLEPNIRIDTHQNNKRMQHLLEKNGFTYCGIILTEEQAPRLAYQK